MGIAGWTEEKVKKRPAGAHNKTNKKRRKKTTTKKKKKTKPNQKKPNKPPQKKKKHNKQPTAKTLQKQVREEMGETETKLQFREKKTPFSLSMRVISFLIECCFNL